MKLAGNPWPCERCGNPIIVAARAGRLPLSALLCGATAVWLGALAVLHRSGGVLGEAVLVEAALLLVLAFGLRSRATRLWKCPACGLRARARLRHAGPVRPVIVVPAYDNASSIRAVLQRVRAAARDLPIIVVDDGSRDGTGERAREALVGCENDSTVLTQPRNYGKGAAILCGLREALVRGHSHVITIDADGQHFPEDLPEVRRTLAVNPSAIIVGARDLSAASVQGVSRFGRSFSNFWLRVQTGVKLADSQSGFRVYPVAPTLSLGLRGRGYDFEVEVLVMAARAGMPLVAMPIRVYYPPPAERVSHFDLLWDNVRISWVNARLLAGAAFWPWGWPARLAKGDPPLARSRPWSGRSRGGAIGHLIFFSVIRVVGRRVAYLLLYPVAFYFMFATRPAVRASRAFLEVAVGPAPGAWRSFWRSYRHLLTFAQCILDRAITEVSGGRGFTWKSEGEEVLAGCSSGALLVSAHLGNYEVGGALLHTGGFPLNVVMLDAEAQAIKAVHDRFGAAANTPKIIAINRGEFPALSVLGALRRGELVALHGDRIIDERWVWCDFFGRPAPFPTGLFLIAAAARVPLVLTFGFKEGTNHYHFIAEQPRIIDVPRDRRDDALVGHARWYAERLEYYARRYPLQWFNFYDFWATPPKPKVEVV